MSSQPASGVLDVSTNPLEMGGSLTNGGPFAGLIDDVRIYPAALTLSQVQTDMMTPVATTSDTQSPSAPTTLAVTAASTTQLSATWNASTDNVGVAGYRIERCSGVSCTTFSQVGTAITTGYSDTGLAASSSYTYRVRAIDAANNLSGYSASASATTLTPIPAPSAPSAPAPASGVASVSVTAAISWTASTNATQYDVAFGTTNPPAIVSSNQTVTTYQPAARTAGTTYYWQIVAKGGGGSTSGAIWSFTTALAPSVPAGPTPAAGATGVSLTAPIAWTVSTNATQYDVAFGTTNPPAIVASNQTVTTYQPAARTAGTKYYWQIVAKGAGGSTSGAIWSFTTTAAAPSAPASPTPATGATGVSLTSAISWSALTNATQDHVAFGTTTPPAIVSSNQTATTYQPATQVAGTTYYWQIVAKGAGGLTQAVRFRASPPRLQRHRRQRVRRPRAAPPACR